MQKPINIFPNRSKSYSSAIQKLQSLISASHGPHTQSIVPKDPFLNVVTTRRGLERLGLLDNMARMKVIHIAGTKGKGSTAAMCEALMLASKKRTALFTSPHLIDIRERIRLNGESISQEAFADAFFAVEAVIGKVEGAVDKSVFFRWLTWMFFYAAVTSSCEVLVVEVGLGGRCDSTNAMDTVTVSGITSIGFDHMEILGHTLPEIASEKAGIMKPSVPCYVSDSNTQREEVMKVFRERASAAGTSVFRASSDIIATADLGIGGEHTRENAALAVALSRTVLNGRSALQDPLTDSERATLAAVRLHGRCETVVHPSSGVPFYIDGAHTVESMSCCIRWFRNALGTRCPEIIVLFNCMPPRDPGALLQVLHNGLQGLIVRHVYFTVPLSSKDLITYSPVLVDTTWQDKQRIAWTVLHPSGCSASVTALRSELLEGIHKGATDVVVLVTGSLYLVGDVLSLLLKQKSLS